MSDFANAVVLGIVQGLTEFLPISSSGHLVLAEHWLPGWNPPGILFDALLHVGTLVSVFMYYRKDLLDLVLGFFRGQGREVHFTMMLIAGSVPTAAIGLGFKDTFEAWFSSPTAVGGFLLVTAGLLLVAKRYWWLASVGHVSLKDALVIGTFQGLAIAPGVSRAGSTVTAALWRGIDPALAAKFSFFLGIPAILGATVLQFADGRGADLPALHVVASGMLAAAISGYVAIRIFVGLLVKGRFVGFAIYCAALGMAARLWG